MATTQLHLEIETPGDLPDEATLIAFIEGALEVGSDPDAGHALTYKVRQSPLNGCTGYVDPDNGLLLHDGNTYPIHEGAPGDA